MERGDRLTPAQKLAFNAFKEEHAEEMKSLKEQALKLIQIFEDEYMDPIHDGISCAKTQELIDKYHWAMNKVIDVIWEHQRDAKEENIIYPQEVLEATD